MGTEGTSACNALLKYLQILLSQSVFSRTLKRKVRKRTIPTEGPPLVRKVSANFGRQRGVE
jgi:hypothetical protein